MSLELDAVADGAEVDGVVSEVYGSAWSAYELVDGRLRDDDDCACSAASTSAWEGCVILRRYDRSKR